MSVAGTVELKDEYLQVANYKDGPSNPFYNLNGMQDFYFVYDENMSQVALDKIFKALYAANNPGRLAELTGIIYGNGGNDKGLIGTLEDAARLVNEKKAIFEDYEKVMTQIDNIQSEYSIASQQFEMVMIDLIGDKETWTSSETGGLLGALRSNFVELQKTYPSGTDNNNYLAIDRSITDIDTIIKALKGSQGKNGNWTDTTTIITFSTRWTSEVSNALSRLFSIACEGDSADTTTRFDFATSTVPEALRSPGDPGTPILTKDNMVITYK
ncbi:MAG: hypothetical protein K2L24_01325, partial [Opitutales bacterium]|nr:hypothetical protein [Opitutales bacterium]